MVAGYMQLLARRYKGRLDPEADEFIGYAVEGVERMRDLIDDLLAYARVGAASGAWAAWTPGRSSGASWDPRRAVSEAGAEIVLDELPAVEGDEAQLGQLFQNLLANALKFRADHAPRIEIGAPARGGGWRFRVRDNGIGIEPRHAERVFKIFQRLHGRDEYPGTGIGLAICKRMVERHGGTIEVHAAAGGGTEFSFTVPDSVEEAR